MRKPQPAPELPEDVAEVLHDALEGRHRSAESYEEDVRDAFQALPKANIEAAAAVCHVREHAQPIHGEQWAHV